MRKRLSGKDIIEYAVRADMPDRKQVLEKCLQSEVSTSQKPIASFRKGRLAFAAVAVAVVFIMLVTRLMPHTDSDVNIFTIQAFAMDMSPDSETIFREIDLLEERYTLGGFLYEETFYLNIGFNIRGENIRDVVITTDEGFFAKQFPDFGVEENGFVVKLYGSDFIAIGNNVTIYGDEVTHGMMLFVGIPIMDIRALENLTIYVIATFNDGATQEETFTLYINNELNMRLEDNIDDTTPIHSEWWNNVSIDEAQLVPSSVLDIAEVHDGVIYEYQLEGFHEPFIIYGYQLDFQEYNISWGGFMSDFRVSDGYVYFSLIRRNADYTLTGMVYRYFIGSIDFEVQGGIIGE